MKLTKTLVLAFMVTLTAAAKRVAEAEGIAEARIAEARGLSEAIKLEGEALRQYPEVLQQQSIAKWNGTLPRVMSGEGGVVPFINVDPERKN